MLAWKEFKYTPFLVDDEFVHRPFVGVTLSLETEKHSAFCLVDSGSDDIIFDMEIAKELGLDPLKQTMREIGWFAGATKGFDTTLTVTVERFEHAPMRDCKVTFVENLPLTGILGHDFFSAFYVQFQHQRNTLKIATAPKLT